MLVHVGIFFDARPEKVTDPGPLRQRRVALPKRSSDEAGPFQNFSEAAVYVTILYMLSVWSVPASRRLRSNRR